MLRHSAFWTLDSGFWIRGLVRYAILFLAAAVLRAGTPGTVPVGLGGPGLTARVQSPLRTITENVNFSKGDFRLAESQGYGLVIGQAMDVTDQPGAPQLPVRPVSLTLPVRARVTAVRAEPEAWVGLETGVTAFPAQQQAILSKSEKLAAFTAPDPAVYESSQPWPAEPAVWTGTSTRDGRTVVELLVYPVRYAGSSRQLEYCPRFTVKVEYDPLPATASLSVDALDYVIVTSTAFDTIFQRLADWKTQKGVRTVIRHIDWVTSTYPGRDNAEKLRNYLKTLPDSGAEYVLLGGDVNVIPFRKAFAMTSEGGFDPREDSLPCDLYFADLDGTWDANNNNVFGEVDDSVDLYTDIAVGRAPAENTADARAFVNKLLKYERSPSPAYLDNVLFFAEVMWLDPYTDGGVHKDRLESASFATGYEVTKLYGRLGNESRTSVMAAMRQGQNFLNHDGHGWIDVMSCGSGSLGTSDLDTITNPDHGILYSIGCWTTAFDYNSIGEAWVNNPNGGGVAMIGNSSYGWGSPGNPGFGYSDKFDDRFWWAIKHEGVRNVGRALAWSKAWYAPFARGRNVYRWHQYEVNLMGCPEMPAYTETPCSLHVTASAGIPLGRSQLLVTVADSTGAPVPGASVCLMKGSESYSRALTGSAGAAWLEATPATAGDFTLTVTGHNYYPAVTTIPCSSGVYVNFAGWTIDDAAGNGDGVANPGELVRLPVWMHNAGTNQSPALELLLRASDPGINIEDSAALIGPLAPGESIFVDTAFAVAIGTSPEDGHVTRFELVVRDTASSDQRVFHPVLQVGRPALHFSRYNYTRPPAIPGETKSIRLSLVNTGLGWAHDAWAGLASLDPHVSVLAPESISLGEVAPGSACNPSDSLRVSIDTSCPGSYLAPALLTVRSDDYVFTDTFSLLVGEYGFADDMESGDARWTHGGTLDQWHVSTNRSHSGSHSWYSGDSLTHRYNNNMNSWLQTLPFMVAENCSLSFWRWSSVPNYGVDGIYVIVVRASGADTLDFIGTGGALGEPYPDIESEWYQETYDLNWIPVGETIQVKIPFKSDTDGDVGEGFYIDDFEVSGAAPGVPAVLETVSEIGPRLELSAHPTPFLRSVRVRLNGVIGPNVSARICDAAGRVVKTLTLTSRAGLADLVWNGTDDHGRRLPAGAYFIDARAGARSARTKTLMGN